MDEKELGDRLSNINHAEIELPEHRRQLKRALFQFAQTNPSPAEKVGRGNVSLRRLTWQTAIAGVATVVIIASLSLALPSLTGHDQKALASEIALNDINVQAAIAGDKIQETGLTVISPGVWRIVMKVSEDRFVVVVTDVNNHSVLSVVAETSDNQSQQRAVDIAQADPRVLELLNTPNHGMSTSTEFTSEAIEMLHTMGITDTENLVELTVWVLPATGNEYIPNSFAIDINAGTVIYLGNVPVGGELGNGLSWRVGASGGPRTTIQP